MKKEQRTEQSVEQLRFLNDTAHDLISQTDNNDAIQKVLEKMVRYFGGSRACVFELNYENETAVNTYEACAPDVASQKDFLQAVPFEACEFWFNTFKNDDYVSIDDLNDLDDSRRKEKELLLKQNISSLIALPIMRNNKLVGYAGIIEPTKNKTHVQSLLFLRDFITSLIIRRNLSEKILRNANAITNMMNDMPGAFSRIRLLPNGSTNTVFVNDGFCTLTGMSREEVLALYGDNSLSGVHPDDLPLVRSALKSLESTEIVRTECRLRHGREGYVRLRVFGRVTKKDAGETFLNIYLDEIPEQNKLELQRKELIENLPCGAGIYLYKEGKISVVYLNDKYRELVSRKLEDVENVPALDAVHPDDRAKLVKTLLESLQGGQRGECDLKIVQGDGTYRLFHLTGNCIKQADGTAYIYTTYTPISEAEITFRDMIPTALAAMMASSTDLSFVKDEKLIYICCSRAFAHLVGLKSEKEIVGKTDFDIFTKEFAEQYRKDDLRLMKSGESLIDYVERIPSFDGSLRYSNTSKYILKDMTGKVIGLYGTGRDITENREAYSRLKFLTDTIPGGICMYEVSSKSVRLVYLSDGVWKLTGYSESEYAILSESSVFVLVNEEDLPLLQAQVEALRQKGTDINCTYRITTKNDETKWINLRGTVAEANGDKKIVNAVLYDVTLAKSAESKLQASLRAMEIASQTNNISFWLFNLDTKQIAMEFQSVSPLGYPRVIENVPKSLYEEGAIYPEDIPVYEKMCEALYNGEPKAECTVRSMNKVTKEYEWQHTMYSRLSDELYNARVAIGFSVNADLEQENRQRYEHELQLRQELVKNSIYYYELNLTTGYVDEFSSVYKDIPQMKSGTKLNEACRRAILKNVAPEDKERVENTLFSKALLEAYEKGETSVELVYRRIIPQKGLRWVKASCSFMEKPLTNEIIAFAHLEDVDVEWKDRLAIDAIMDEEIDTVALVNTKTGLAHLVQVKNSPIKLAPHIDFNFDKEIRKIIENQIPPEDKAACLNFYCVKKLAKTLDKETITKLNYKFVESDGTIHRKKARAFYLGDTKQDIVIIRQDITDLYEEEQRQQKALQDAVVEANKANKAKSEFLSRMSHDIRTPLNAVLSFSADELVQKAEIDELRDYLKKIHSSGSFLLEIINNVLDMSKIEQKKFELHETPYPLDEFVNTIKTVIGDFCTKKNIEFVVDTSEAKVLCVLVDKTRFNQIFINLLSNAVKFTPNGGKVEFIVKRYTKIVNGVACKRFIVKDNGIGMSPEFIPNAFDTFAQEANRIDAAKNPGTGLGLAIVKEIVTLMGGNISLESKLNQGTTFTVDLPLKVCEVPQQKKKTAQAVKSLKGLKVLLCEDNELNAEVATKLFEMQGCIVDCAKNGKEGVEKFNASPLDHYDFVMMDIRMPIMDGIEATKAIRKLPRADAKSIPIVAMTADAFDKDVELCIESGMNAHLGKPVKPQLVFETIRKQLADRNKSK